jgi:hypothetical protein
MKRRHIAGLAFASALALAGFFALYPGPRHPQLLASDKAEHFLCFAVLNAALLLAVPSVPAVVLGLALCALGAGVELLQSTAFIARDGDAQDWIVEVWAVALSAGLILASGLRVRWRAWTGPSEPAVRAKK